MENFSHRRFIELIRLYSWIEIFNTQNQQNLGCFYLKSRRAGYISLRALGQRHLKPYCWIIDGMFCSPIPRGVSFALRPTVITYWEAPKHGSLIGQMDASHKIIHDPGQTAKNYTTCVRRKRGICTITLIIMLWNITCACLCLRLILQLSYHGMCWGETWFKLSNTIATTQIIYIAMNENSLRTQYEIWHSDQIERVDNAQKRMMWMSNLQI